MTTDSGQRAKIGHDGTGITGHAPPESAVTINRNGWSRWAGIRSQFTSQAFTGVLETHGVTISMDGKGCYRDNIFVERLWRSVKYECVYLKAFKDGADLKRELGDYFTWYNRERPHQGLDDATPEEVYFNQPLTQAA